MNTLLANIVSFIHFLIILFVIFAPFSNILYILILHVSFTFCLLIHWRTNSNACSLSLLESKLRGVDYTKTYMHKFISPIYDISETELSRWCYIVTTITMIISIYKIYKLPKTYESIKCFKEINKTNKTFFEKVNLYKNCIINMMIP